MSTTTVELDGSEGEGGGQILRSSLALSLLTGKPFHLRNVRARRPKPGLQPQHLMSVRSAAEIGKATVRGATLQSSDLVFEPGPVTAGKYTFDIRTAGATSLVLHTLYLPLALAGGEPSELTLIGGTHVQTSPSFHFLDITWRRYLERLGLKITLRMLHPGFYPRGGGHVIANIQPTKKLRGFRWRERGPVAIGGFSAVAGLPEHIAQRQARRAIFRLSQAGYEATLREESWDGGPGSFLGIVVQPENKEGVPALFAGNGARGKPAERVADEAVEEALGYLHAAPAAVDAHSGDQLVLPLALAEGPSEYTVAQVTQHLHTNVGVIRRFVEREIVVEGEEGAPGVVRVQ